MFALTSLILAQNRQLTTFTNPLIDFHGTYPGLHLFSQLIHKKTHLIQDHHNLTQQLPR